jgi:hypothetical protein
MSVRQAVLSKADCEHFLEHGYVIVHEVAAPDVLAAAVRALEADAGSPAAAEAIAACVTDRVHGAIGDLFGPDHPFVQARGGHDMMRPHQPEGEWPTPAAHVDDAYPTIMPNGWAVGSFLFLTPVKSRGGAFICFPDSPWRYRQQLAAGHLRAKDVAPMPEHSGRHMEFLAEPGDLLLFHQLMGHCGSNNVADPVTRHALLARWHPQRRIVPGRKPFEAMSLIEKVNSARYLNHRFDLDLPIPEKPADGRTEARLRAGSGGLGRVMTCAVIHYNGAQLLYADESNPRVIRRMSSNDLINWDDAGVVELDLGVIDSLQLHQYGLDVILGVTSGSQLILFATRDFTSWSLLSRVTGCATATPWFAYAKYPTKIAAGNTVFTVPDSSRDSVVCHWGERWEEAGGWETASVALRAPSGSRIRDVTIAAHFSDSTCAFVIDLQAPEAGEGETLPHYALPLDVAVADESLQRLPWDGPGPPRNIRVFNRARSYWMVTYLVRVKEEEDRLFWGTIDWSESQPTLRPISCAEELDQANCIVGMV